MRQKKVKKKTQQHRNSFAQFSIAKTCMNEGVTSGHCCEYYVVAITTARWRTERERERGNIINAQALGVTWKVLTTTFRLGLAANTAKFTQFTPSTLKTTTYKKKKKKKKKKKQAQIS